MMGETLEVDVAIVGGGLVGGSLAVSLEQSGLKVALIEPTVFSEMDKPSFDARSIALSLSSINFFKTLGLWQELLRHAYLMKTIHVSEKGNFGKVKLTHQDLSVEYLGAVIELYALNRALHKRLKENAKLSLYEGFKVISLNQQSSTLTIQDQNNNQQDIRAKLIVAADGTYSSIRSYMGLESDLTQTDFGQMALVCNVGLKRDPEGVAFERFTEQGPLALLPLVNKRAALVWSLAPKEAKVLLHCRDATFLERLQETFGYRLGQFITVGRRALFPLKSSQMKTLSAGKVIFIGNAAQTLHPIAGQGFNLALRDVAHLSEHLMNQGISESLFKAYACLREQDRASTIGFGEGLLHGFMQQNVVMKNLRASSLAFMDLNPRLKKLLMKRAIGFAGKVPKSMLFS